MKFYHNWPTGQFMWTGQCSKIALICSYLRVPQTAGQVEILIFLVKITFFPMYEDLDGV